MNDLYYIFELDLYPFEKEEETVPLDLSSLPSIKKR